MKDICSFEVTVIDQDYNRFKKTGILVASHYTSDNSLAMFVELEGGEMYCKLSINVDAQLEDNEFVLNHDIKHDESFMLEILKTNLIEDTGKTVCYGYVKDRPVYRVLVPLY